jgi:hypothetical protein
MQQWTDQEALIEMLTDALEEVYLDTLWNAYGVGIERDGKWMSAGMKDAECLESRLGLTEQWHDAPTIKGQLPELAKSMALNTVNILKDRAKNGPPSPDPSTVPL